LTAALKQRLVGAALLVALAVIFVPMLLDGSGARQRLNDALTIPEQPEAPASSLDQPELADADPSTGGEAAEPAGGGESDRGNAAGNEPSEDAAQTAPDAAPESAPEAGTDPGDESATEKATASADGQGAASASTPTSAEPDSDAEPEVADASSTQADSPADDQAAEQDRYGDNGGEGASAGGEASEPAGGASPSGDAGEPDEGWIIQAGSFREETNAVVLRDKLREAGFDAYAERTVGDNGTWWRVRVGPVGDRGGAERLKGRLESELRTGALLMSYP
jgi:DedD protein